MLEIKNDSITLQVAEKGAEIKSLKVGDREFMWQGDPKYWGRTAPVLFPLVGSLHNKQFISHGKTYDMGQHGFARDTVFELVKQTENELTMRLQSNAETLQKFPYEFELEISYTLEGNRVRTTWKVSNPATEDLHFSIGGHPAFNCEMEGYTYHIYEKSGCPCGQKLVPASKLNYVKLGQGGTVHETDLSMELSEGVLPITPELFLGDAIIVVDSDVTRIALADPSDREIVVVDFVAPAFGLWSPAGKNAPFVCIEPWYGTADWDDKADGIWETRKYANVLKPGEVFEKTFAITVNA